VDAQIDAGNGCHPAEILRQSRDFDHGCELVGDCPDETVKTAAPIKKSPAEFKRRGTVFSLQLIEVCRHGLGTNGKTPRLASSAAEKSGPRKGARKARGGIRDASI
jgi:hypothetical protein